MVFSHLLRLVNKVYEATILLYMYSRVMLRIFEVIQHAQPTFILADSEREEYNCSDDYIDKIFDFTYSFNDLNYWDSTKYMNMLSCDNALIHIRQALLQMQSDGIRPRNMTAEERAYYRFPSWWFGYTECPDASGHVNGTLLPLNVRKCILMRHLVDMYNEIRARPEFRSNCTSRLFYCTYPLC